MRWLDTAFFLWRFHREPKKRKKAVSSHRTPKCAISGVLFLYPHWRRHAGERQCRRLFRFYIDDLNAVVIRIGDVEFVAGEAEAGGFVEEFGIAAAKIRLADFSD